MTKSIEAAVILTAAERLAAASGDDGSCKGPAMMDVREIQPSRGTSIIAAGLGDHAESLDAVAGSEFVDDRIRLRE